MSKITPKNLSYDSTLPPFLQALRAGQSDHDGRHERAIARPRRARDAQEIEDEAPVVVDERGEVVEDPGLNKEEGKKGDGEIGDEEAKEEEGSREKEGGARKDAKVAIGGSRKRKGRVVGGDGEDENDNVERTYEAGIKEGTALAAAIKADEAKVGKLGVSSSGTGAVRKSEAAGKKKKAKKIKLSFDEE